MRRGITIIETLVVIAICIVVLGGGVMFIAKFRERAAQAHCHENLRRIGMAVKAYQEKTDQVLPPACIAEGYATWPVLLAPFMQATNPLAKWDLEQSYVAQPAEIREACLVALFCPARTRTDARSVAGDIDALGMHFSGGLGDYASVAGDGTADNGALVSAEVVKREGDRVLAWKSRTSLASLTRGESYTYLIGEKHVLGDHFGDAKFGDGSPYNGANPASYARLAGPGFRLAQTIDEPFNKQFGSWHNGICHFLLADSSARAVPTATLGEFLGKMARRGND